MKMNIKYHQGFSLIELIVIIAILGILAAVAVPRLFSISTQAEIATTNTMASALSSANAENYAVRIVNPSNGIAIKNCTSAANLLQGGLSSDYKIKSKSVAVDKTVSCTLNGPSSTSATFVVTGIK